MLNYQRVPHFEMCLRVASMPCSPGSTGGVNTQCKKDLHLVEQTKTVQSLNETHSKYNGLRPPFLGTIEWGCFFSEQGDGMI